MLVSYVIKIKSGVKNVLVLSSVHRNALTIKDERKKPHLITFYNITKGGVDVMDMMTGIDTTQFKSLGVDHECVTLCVGYSKNQYV